MSSKVPKTWKKDDLLQEGKGHFSPRRQPNKGKIDDFDFDLWDFKDSVLRDDVTVKNMYDEVNLPMLRFYLASVKKST